MVGKIYIRAGGDILTSGSKLSSQCVEDICANCSGSTHKRSLRVVVPVSATGVNCNTTECDRGAGTYTLAHLGGCQWEYSPDSSGCTNCAALCVRSILATAGETAGTKEIDILVNLRAGTDANLQGHHYVKSYTTAPIDCSAWSSTAIPFSHNGASGGLYCSASTGVALTSL